MKKIFQKHWFSKKLDLVEKKIRTRNESIFKHFRAHCVPAILDSLSFRRFFWIWWWRHRKNITYNTSIYLLTEQEEPRDFAPKRWCRESSTTSSSSRKKKKKRPWPSPRKRPLLYSSLEVVSLISLMLFSVCRASFDGS